MIIRWIEHPSHSLQEILDKEYAEISIRCNRIDIYIFDKRKNNITLIDKPRKYDRLENEMEIIPYLMTWDGIVTKYLKTYVKRLQIPINVETYILFIPLEKRSASLRSISGAEMHKQPKPL
ncbi:hypothetical protein CWI38_0042p0080 [Hamiltosporidium tvaerminnensis]|uniref:Uncharacterized protein n=1 Tax=Hamiltosporidium tvaerminnensis TaxID=1176355 RepID=A0A4Q9M1U5_9MICR|nr:hypothetical protein CWI38_0042p0080 [Hamiltosporidium tvaerminnensis]